MAHGFDSYYGVPYSVDMGQSAWNVNGEFPPLPLIQGLAANSSKYIVNEQPANLDTLSKRYAGYASNFIATTSAASKPWLLYMAFQHVHTPDFASPEFCGRSKRGLFGDVVEELDWVVGQIQTAVAAAGQTKNTIVFFTSDNG
jgi:arylsulfatase A